MFLVPEYSGQWHNVFDFWALNKITFPLCYCSQGDQNTMFSTLDSMFWFLAS